MTYLQFHLVFTLPLFLCVLFLCRHNSLTFSRRGIWGTALLVFLAISYTTPWDSYLIHENIWSYQPGRVIGTLFLIPFEEYFFFFIQTLIGCFVTSSLITRFLGKMQFPMKLPATRFGVLIFILLLQFILFLMIEPPSQWRYLYLIITWSLPVLTLQVVLGWEILRKNYGIWWGATVGLSLYFWIADSIAIANKIWTFPEHTISGVELFGILPIEEALFFLVTNLMVVQGYLLFTTVDFKNFKLIGAKELP